MVKGLRQQATISLTRNIAMNRMEAINWVWSLCILLRQSQTRTLADLVRNAMKIAVEHGFVSIAFPLIGAGLGGFNQERAKQIMTDALGKCEGQMAVRLVVYLQ